MLSIFGNRTTALLRLITLLVTGMVCTPTAYATSMQDLYDVSIPVADQSSSQRNEAMRSGMQTVLVRISGQAQTIQNTRIQQALKKPEAYLQQFSYRSNNSSTNTSGNTEATQRYTEAGKAEVVPSLLLDARFSKPAIENLLREAGLPIWSSNRPSVLVWGLVDAGSGKQFLQQLELHTAQANDTSVFNTETGNDIDNNVIDVQPFITPYRAAHTLETVMAQRGLPLLNPRYDTQDRVLVNANSLWQQNTQPVLQASARYQPDSVLMGRIAQSRSGNWIGGQWLYLFQGQQHVIEVEADSLDDFISQGVAGVVQVLAARYTIDTLQADNHLYLEVAGIHSFPASVKVRRHLESLEPVTQLNIDRVQGEHVRYRLNIEGGQALFEELLSLGGILIADPDAGLRYKTSNASNSTINVHETMPDGMSYNDDLNSNQQSGNQQDNSENHADDSPLPQQAITLYYRLQP